MGHHHTNSERKSHELPVAVSELIQHQPLSL